LTTTAMYSSSKMTCTRIAHPSAPASSPALSGVSALAFNLLYTLIVSPGEIIVLPEDFLPTVKKRMGTFPHLNTTRNVPEAPFTEILPRRTSFFAADALHRCKKQRMSSPQIYALCMSTCCRVRGKAVVALSAAGIG
jgi:hypothetical protein